MSWGINHSTSEYLKAICIHVGPWSRARIRMWDAQPCACPHLPSGWGPGPPDVHLPVPQCQDLPAEPPSAWPPSPGRCAGRKDVTTPHSHAEALVPSAALLGREAPPPARSRSSPLSSPSPSPLCFIAVLRSGRNVIHGASASQYREAALKYVLCGRLVGWGLSRCLMGWGELSREEMGGTDR